MDVFLRIDINILAIVLLCTVLFIANRRLDKQEVINKTYLTVSRIIVLELLFETVTCIINKRPELWLGGVSSLLHICLFITGPVLTYFWFVFIRSMIFKDSPVQRKWRLLLFVPVVFNAVLAVLSPLYKLLFYITSDNVYHRGYLFNVSAAMVYFYLLLGSALIIINRRKIVKQDFLPLCILAILPVVGGIVQTLLYGTLLMWSCTAFSLIIVYIYLKERMVHLDYLTSTWTRDTFDHFIAQSIKPGDKSRRGIIYIDIDDLKHINDAYGHAEGDLTLKTATQIVKSAIRKNDMIARLGGDEFAVILSCDDCSQEMLEHTVNRIETAFGVYNTASGKPYKLQCSLGADIFNPESHSLEAFMGGIDALMYESKKKKKPVGIEDI